MKNYNHAKIDELLQPLMKMMQEEFPNGFKLIVEPYFSQIVYEHSEMVFPSDEMKKPLCETAPMKNFAKDIERMVKAFETAETPTADTADKEANKNEG